MDSRLLVVSSVSDDPFAIDVAHFFGQTAEIADLISLKRFANTEVCPRFISDERDYGNVGNRLQGMTVIIVSTCCGNHTRNALAMRNCLVGRAAKDNGAEHVVLVEPDLYYSAQDRGPRPDHGTVDFERSSDDYKKFDGQPFSSRLYAQLLQTSGVDEVVTIHNHSVAVERLFADVFEGRFHNLSPASLYADYLVSDTIDGVVGKPAGVVLCAPDEGAAAFVRSIYDAIMSASESMLLTPSVGMLFMQKRRSGERRVEIRPVSDSPVQLDSLTGHDVIVFDDMVRTGYTIMECCTKLKEAGARRVVFVVTHFHSSDEVKENLNTPAIDEIITTNTLPAILNRDMQGRLRKKMLVLKIEKWIARFLLDRFGLHHPVTTPPLYAIDMSSKNRRTARSTR
ncbi:MAG: ribose-phosphate pyrophosphokinase-like domain-containing protein [Candidatus Pacebacteria bacterium]|nr:ribose-phosphate pyrophosphokinase-like domain-containing protein [Candidatus Paceibacterota bacterium]